MRCAVPPAPQIQTQFQRHIKAGQRIYRIQLRSRDVVNAVLAVFNQILNLGKSNLARVAYVLRTLGLKPMSYKVKMIA